MALRPCSSSAPTAVIRSWLTGSGASADSALPGSQPESSVRARRPDALGCHEVYVRNHVYVNWPYLELLEIPIGLVTRTLTMPTDLGIFEWICQGSHGSAPEDAVSHACHSGSIAGASNSQPR